MPSLLLSLLLATAAVADGGVGQPVDAGVTKPADAGIAQAVDAGAEPLRHGLHGLSAPVEQHRAEAQDTRRPLAQRLESALRAATLAPEDAALRKLLGELFYERQLELAAADKPSTKTRTFSRMCHQETDDSCLLGFASRLVTKVRLSSRTRDSLFVIVVGLPERWVVYRGRYQFPKARKDSASYPFKGELLAEESFKPSPILVETLLGKGEAQSRYASKELGALPFGQFILDEPSQEALRAIPRQWSRLEPAPEVKSFSNAFKKGPVLKMWWNCPEDRPVQLDFEVDIHGRWRLHIPEEGAPWIAAVEKVDGGLQLKLVRDEETWVEEGQRPIRKVETLTKQVLFKLPPENEDVAWLGDVPYSSKLGGYPRKPHPPCN